jgi:alpha-N-arabinofuranosidase
MKKLLFLFTLLTAASVAVGEPVLTIQADKVAGQVSPTLYGLMTEEINHSYDGGLYAELIQNRAFQDSHDSPVDWFILPADNAATMALDTNETFNGRASLRLEVSAASPSQPAGIANRGYWGIPVYPSEKYHVTFYAKESPGFSGPVTASIVSNDGSTVFAKGVVSSLTSGWQMYEVTLETSHDIIPTASARFVLSVDQPGTVWFGYVSLFPPTWKDQPNGFRGDLMQMLVDMNPKFLRLPGGNYLEGDNTQRRFIWKETIGPVAMRKGHRGPWGYRSTDGLGLMEYLLWCEDMGAEPVLAVYAGYSLNGKHTDPGPELEPFVQDALDEIEYVAGPTNTQWGAERAADGHPEPFPLHYVEIGNEDWFDKSGSYDARYTQFYNAIKAKYPELTCISTIGNDASAKLRVTSCKPDMFDEHYYRSADTFLNDAVHFDHYDRQGPKIFVGEWAAYETSFPPWDRRSAGLPPTPDMKSALGDAAWMIGMERNSDLIKMQSYAPLMVNVSPGARQWRPDLIGYDALHCFGSPSYYAIKMFGDNVGDEILSASIEGMKPFYSVTKDSKNNTIIIKLLNDSSTPQPIKLDIQGANLRRKGTALTLAAPPDATNSINDRTHVVPVSSKVTGVKSDFDYTLPANSVVVLTLKTKE